jgi:hypothetical protein
MDRSRKIQELRIEALKVLCIMARKARGLL